MNMPDVASLTHEVSELTDQLKRWNTIIIALMVLAALAATGLVVVQRIAFKRAERLAEATDQLSKLKELAANEGIAAANEEAGAANERAANAEKGTAEATRGTALARADAAHAGLQAAKANARAADAKARAAHLEIEALSLRKETNLQGPRARLLSVSWKEIVNALKPFAGQRVEVRSEMTMYPRAFPEPVDQDSVHAAMTLIGIFADAGWKVPPMPLVGAMSGSGVSVEISPRASNNTVKSANELVYVLARTPLVVLAPLTTEPKRPTQIPTFTQEGKQVFLEPLGTDTIIVTVMAHP